MKIWWNSKGVPQWSKTWKWNLQNGDLNSSFDVLVPLAIYTSFICISVGRKMLKLT